MKLVYLIIFILFYPFNAYSQEFSCIDKKYGRLSKMIAEEKFIKYQDEKGKPIEYKIVENSKTMLMGISKGVNEVDPILNYVFVLKNKNLAFNSILRTIKVSYNEIYSDKIIMKCIGKID